MKRRLLAAALVATALGSLGLVRLLPAPEPSYAVSRRDSPSTDTTSVTPRSTTTTHPTEPVGSTGTPAGAGGTVRPVRPVRLGIPAIALSTRLIDLGLQSDGTVEVPADPDRAGWFAPGPVPGEVGSSVLLGHVDSRNGPAIFARLSELTKGDAVNVRIAGGRLVRFRIRVSRTYANADFPAEKVYGDHGRSTLVLVTCGGTYDPERGGYQANVVVYAEPLSPPAT